MTSLCNQEGNVPVVPKTVKHDSELPLLQWAFRSDTKRKGRFSQLISVRGTLSKKTKEHRVMEVYFLVPSCIFIAHLFKVMLSHLVRSFSPGLYETGRDREPRLKRRGGEGRARQGSTGRAPHWRAVTSPCWLLLPWSGSIQQIPPGVFTRHRPQAHPEPVLPGSRVLPAHHPRGGRNMTGRWPKFSKTYYEYAFWWNRSRSSLLCHTGQNTLFLRASLWRTTACGIKTLSACRCPLLFMVFRVSLLLICFAEVISRQGFHSDGLQVQQGDYCTKLMHLV